MVQTVATLFSLLFAAAAMAVIVLSVAEGWLSLRRALGLNAIGQTPLLPARTRQLVPARRARMVRINPEGSPRRVAA